MATKELWEIELDIKLDKFGNAGKVYEDNVKRVIEYDKRFTASVKSEAKIREKVILQTLAEEKRANDVAFREKMQMAKQYDAALLEDFKRTQAKLKAERDKLNQPGESVQLKGDVGSAAYVSQLKAIQRELSPTSAQFKQLSETIRQYEAELNKANKSSGLMAFKNLTVAIKETKGELARLAAEQKTGTAEWQRYSDKLRELQRQKQLIQRETKLTSQQLIAMSRDLTVVAYGLRTIGQDIISLSQGKQSAGEMALAIGGIGMQVLVVLPAIHGLTKALEAAGIVSTATITKLAALSATLGTLAGGIAVVTVAYGTMVGAATHVVDIFGRIGDVLSGQMGYWEAVAENLKDVTFGLIDVTDASNNFDSSNVQQQLSDLAYIANFSANAMANLKQQVQDALSINTSKFMEYAIKNKLPESFAGPFIDPSNRPGYYDENGTWHEGVKKNRGGTPRSNTKSQKEAELNFLDKFREKVKNLENDIKTLNTLMSSADIKEYEKLAIQDQLIAKQRELNELKRINLGLGTLPETISLDNLLAQEVDLPGMIMRRGIKLPYINTPDMRPDYSAVDMQRMMDEELAKGQQQLAYTNEMWTNFQDMLQSTGLMKGDMAEIVAIINSAISTGNSITGIVKGFMGLFPGGSLISSVIGNEGGGGGAQGLPNYTMPGNGPVIRPIIKLSGELSKMGKWKIVSDGNDVIAELGTGVISDIIN
jgi:hypothetical protein